MGSYSGILEEPVGIVRRLSSPNTATTITMIEKELTSPVVLTTAEGKFNKAAHGWARQPIVDTTGIDGTTFTGKNRRWEYWLVMTPTHLLAFSIANIDYFAPASVWIFDRRTQKVVEAAARAKEEDAVKLPSNVEDGPASADIGDIHVNIDQVPGGTRIRASIPGASFDVMAHMPEGHERLAVVVPWDDVLFQYTVKDISRPAEGTVTIGDETFPVPKGESWAMLDHGRGRWPSNVTIGLQVGDKWTDGTGSTENSFLLGTKVFKISEKLTWDYSMEDPMKPWHVHGAGLDAVLTPYYDKASAYETPEVTTRTDQCFGYWKGTFDNGEEVIEFDNLDGFAEDVTKKW